MTPTTTRRAAPGQDRRRSVGSQAADRIQIVRRESGESKRHRERDRDRHPAQPGHGERVDLPLGVRLVEQAVPDREQAHERGDRQAHDERHGGGQGGQHRPPMVAVWLGHLAGGRGGRIRTGGLLLPKQAIYQTDLRPDVFRSI